MEELLNMRIRCPERLNVSWVNIPPYIYNSSGGEMRGVFHEILKDMVKSCCKASTTVNYTEELNGLGRLQEVMQNSTDDVFLPVYGNNKKKYVLGQPFISLVESPGIAFFYGKESSAQLALVESFLTSWPVLVVILISALITGTCFWLMEVVREDSSNLQKYEPNSGRNGKESGRFLLKIVKGPWDGFYWAIVTLTTVGYGDFCPKSVGGRFLAMLWILFGTIILSMFTASITTGLITAVLSNQVSLAGSTVAVLTNSKESYIATKKNAIAVPMSDIEELATALQHKHSDGILIDSYIAGHYQKNFEKFLLADIIEYVFTYGLVLKNKGLWLEQCFRLYPEVYKDTLFRKLSSSIVPFKPLKFGNQVSEKSSSILDVRSQGIRFFLIGVGALIIFLILSGFVKDRQLKKAAKKNNVNEKESNDVRDEGSFQIQRQRHLKETCETVQRIQDEVQTFNISLDRLIRLTMKEGCTYELDEDSNQIGNGDSCVSNGH